MPAINRWRSYEVFAARKGSILMNQTGLVLEEWARHPLFEIVGGRRIQLSGVRPLVGSRGNQVYLLKTLEPAHRFKMPDRRRETAFHLRTLRFRHRLDELRDMIDLDLSQRYRLTTAGSTTQSAGDR